MGKPVGPLRLRIVVVLVVSFGILAAGHVLGRPDLAWADPGYCGVRYGTYPGNDMNTVYVVTNKCNQQIHARVHLPTFGRDATSGCAAIPPYERGYFSDVVADKDWSVQSC